MKRNDKVCDVKHAPFYDRGEPVLFSASFELEPADFDVFHDGAPGGTVYLGFVRRPQQPDVVCLLWLFEAWATSTALRDVEEVITDKVRDQGHDGHYCYKEVFDDVQKLVLRRYGPTVERYRALVAEAAKSLE